jgi:hypothetical protein
MGCGCKGGSQQYQPPRTRDENARQLREQAESKPQDQTFWQQPSQPDKR